MGSKTVWKGAVNDLIALSPNIIVSNSIQAASASDLRKACRHYKEVYDWRVRQKSPVTLGEDQFKTFSLPFTSMDGQLITGTTCMVHVSSDNSVYLLSTETGQIMDTWDNPESDKSIHAKIKTCASITHGEIILIISDGDPELACVIFLILCV
jgi:hypothetical protein